MHAAFLQQGRLPRDCCIHAAIVRLSLARHTEATSMHAAFLQQGHLPRDCCIHAAIV